MSNTEKERSTDTPSGTYAAGKRQHWITTENGSHVLLDGEGRVQAGLGGKAKGEHWGKRTTAPESDSSSNPSEGETPQARFASSTLARIKQHEQDTPAREAEERREQAQERSHPLYHGNLPADLQTALLQWNQDAHAAVRPVSLLGAAAKINGGDVAEAKRRGWDGHERVVPQDPSMQRLRDQLRLPPVVDRQPGVDTKQVSELTAKLTEIIRQQQQSGFDVRPFIKHNDLIPRDMAARLKPNDSLFRPLEDHERFAAIFSDAITEYYAKNSPGQLGLFGDGFGGDKLRSSKTQQRLRWVTIKGSHVLIDGDGVVRGGAGGKLNGKSVKPKQNAGKDQGTDKSGKKKRKKPFVYPNGQTQSIDETGKPTGIETPTLDNRDAKKGDQPGLLDGEGKRKPRKKFEVKPKDKTRPRNLIDGLNDSPGQTDMFGGGGTPDDLVGNHDRTPREAAADAQRKLDSDYEFARSSAVGNAGEDLKGSARHTRNQWRSLAEAESDGTAVQLVTRDKLLENEPHELAIHVQKTPIIALLMHQALKSFPPKPGASKKDRSDYLDAYRNIKKAAERIAGSGQNDPSQASRELGDAVGDEIKRLRGQSGNDSIGIATATDRYNPTANSLVSLNRRLIQTYKKSATVRKVGEFALHFHDQGKGNIAATRAKLVDGVMEVFEGKTMSSIMGTQKRGTKQKRFDAAEAYVSHAKRDGGPKLPAKTAKEATAYMVDEIGLRGVQFGNSVSDKEREHHAKMAAAALVDLADVTGLPLSAISLGGKIGLAMGARGRGRASAHYEPSSQVINLTRKSGVGALAHEWGHAFDHAMTDFAITSFGGKMDADYQSERISKQRFEYNEAGKSSSGIKKKDGKAVMRDMGNDPIWSSMNDVRASLKASGYEKRLGGVISGMVKDGQIARSGAMGSRYWRSTREQFARCFERHIQRKLHKAGRENTYLTGLSDDGSSESGLWPTDSEVDAMAPAFDKLLDTYRTETLGVKDRAKYSAAEKQNWIDRYIDQYATKRPKNSPGQLGLFGDGFDKERPLRSTKVQQKMRWVTIKGSHVLIDGDGVIQGGAGGKLNGKTARPKAKPSKKSATKTPAEFLLGKRAGDAKVVAGMLYQEIAKKKPVSIVGQTVKSAEQLAEVAQVYRDPRFETFRAFFVKDGKVVGHNAYSSRLPGVVAIGPHVPDQITTDLQKLKADGFYLLHNHPSGDPNPSREDIHLTEKFGEVFGDKMLGHTIIDHTQGTIIERDGSHRKYSLENEDLQDRSKATVPNDILDSFVTSTKALGELALQLRPEKDRAVVIFTSVKGKVQLVMDISKDALKTDESKVLGAMRRVARMTSSDRRFLVVPDDESPSDYSHHMAAGFFTDIAAASKESAAESGVAAKRDPIQDRMKASEGVRDHAKPKPENYHVHAISDKYGADQPTSKNGRQLVKGNKGDTGYFVTIDNHPVFVEAKTGSIHRGPRSVKGKHVKSVAGNRLYKSKRIKPDRSGDRNSPGQTGLQGETLRSSKTQQKIKLKDSFEPKTKLDHDIVATIGHDPDDVEYYRDLLNDAHKLLSTEEAETNDDLRNLLSNFGYSGKKTGHIIQAVRRVHSRGGDHTEISQFDEMTDMALRHYPQLLSGTHGESVGKGDAEYALWEKLRQGFEKPISKNDDRVFQLASDMFYSGGKPEDFDDDYESGFADEVFADPWAPKPSHTHDTVPFAAMFYRSFIERYAAVLLN